jgi:hypothetical protein
LLDAEKHANYLMQTMGIFNYQRHFDCHVCGNRTSTPPHDTLFLTVGVVGKPKFADALAALGAKQPSTEGFCENLDCRNVVV